ncbi:MAG: Fic family protein [Chitinispirillales bacterium]|jgi:Fic family protein|nr:Fic family protein [Chitinispirillales bacterium]
MIAEIAALSERLAIRMERQDALRLRKINRVKTIQASLAIEGNRLTENQVTAIMEGRKVVAPLREIQEVKNAIAAYDLYSELDPFSIKDLLRAHAAMMIALVDDPGVFRVGGVGITDGKDIIHTAPPAGRVPVLMEELKNAPDHLLVRSCVFHYEFEFIHPFSDGNGRMGRMWQSLILGKFHPFFRYLPVETMIHRSQQDYYEALNRSTQNADCGVFVDFMLNEILQTMKTHNAPPNEKNGVVSGVVNEILAYIEAHPGCRANEIEKALSIPHRSAQRYLADLKNNTKIEFRGAPKNGGYWRLDLAKGLKTAQQSNKKMLDL